MNTRQRKRKYDRRRAHAGATQDRPRNILEREHYPTVKQGHIVPVAYQRSFATNDFVAVHVPGRTDCVKLNVANAGTRSRFYRRKRSDGTEIDDFEAMLAELENVAGPVLRDIAGDAPLTPDRKGVLAQFLAVQMLRGPAFFSQHHVNIERFVPKTLTRKHVKPALLKQTGGDFKLAREQVVALFRDPTQALMQMLTVSMKVSAVLGSMRWQVLRFDSPLVAYSDQPVVVWPEKYAAFNAPPSTPSFGPLTALEVQAPLSPHLVLLMTWADAPDAENPVQAQQPYAGETNALVIGQADKQWMHQLGDEPPVAGGLIRPLSRAFEPLYTVATAQRSRRRAITSQYLDSVQSKKFLNDIQVVNFERAA